MSITVALNSIYLRFAVYAKVGKSRDDKIQDQIYNQCIGYQEACRNINDIDITYSINQTKYTICNYYIRIIKNYTAQFLSDIYDIILRMWHDANISPTYVAWSAKKYVLIIEQGNDTWH